MTPALSAAAIAVFASAAITDSVSRRIPNRLCAILALLGLVRIAVALAGGQIAAPGLDLGAAFGVFALAALGFRFRVLGGGDVKLLAAGALWLGAPALGPYLLATVLAGGALAVLFVAWRLALPGRAAGPSLPYGVAIAAGGILTTAGGLW
jgi:prepilin peptidase CpaA